MFISRCNKLERLPSFALKHISSSTTFMFSTNLQITSSVTHKRCVLFKDAGCECTNSFRIDIEQNFTWREQGCKLSLERGMRCPTKSTASTDQVSKETQIMYEPVIIKTPSKTTSSCISFNVVKPEKRDSTLKRNPKQTKVTC